MITVCRSKKVAALTVGLLTKEGAGYSAPFDNTAV